MNVLIEKLKISNFLSFFGEYEINLKPFSAIMCNFYEGKDDLFRVFEFVFGADLTELRIENPLDLVHEVLREEFLVNRDIQAYVEVTLSLLQEKKQMKLSRSVKNGLNNVRIEHKISGLVTSNFLYKEKLSSLGVYIKEKNLIFYKNYFDSAMWGSAEELERTVCNCLRESYLLEDWRKAKKEVEYLTKLKKRTAEKNYNAMKKSHSVLEKYINKYKMFCANREMASGRILMDLTNDSSSESYPSEIDSSKTETEDDENKKEKITKLEIKIKFLTEDLCDLKLKEVYLISRLHHEEIKLAAKPVNGSIIQNRISYLKAKVQEKEKTISEIWKEIQKVKSELDNVGKKISSTLIYLRGFQISSYRQNRFTRYGRFFDYLQSSRYVKLLKQVVGPDIFYAHLCDYVEDAFSFMKQIRNSKHENREVFLPFENYPPKLKDTITASGERGIQINTLEELLIFLCKLKHYNLIEEVPVVIKKHCNFDSVPEGYTIYLNNNIHFTNRGLISCKVDDNDFTLGTEKELHDNLTQLCAEQELKFRKWNELLFLKWQILVDMNTLENDILYFKQKWRKYIQKPQEVWKTTPLLEIYEEYRDIFKQHTEEGEKYESELQQEEEPLFEERDSSTSPSAGDLLSVIQKELDDVTAQKVKIQKQLGDMTRELYSLNIIPIHAHNVQKNLIKFRNNNFDKTELFFEKEFKMLTQLITEDDLEDFFGTQEWRKDFIVALIKDFDEIKTKLKKSTEELQNIATARKRKLYQLFEHCSRNLSSTFSHVLDDALPFLKFDFGPGEEKIHIMSSLGEEKVNVVDIKHFNTLVKFISALSVFLEIAKFNKIPFMIMDDIEEYFPHHDDNLSAALDSNNLEKILPDSENQRFHLLMRVGQFLKHYIRKNTPGRVIRNNGNQTDYTNGPIQVIYFAKEDFIHAAEHYIWIQSQILPQEYMTENCNSYSEIHEINFEDMNNP